MDSFMEEGFVKKQLKLKSTLLQSLIKEKDHVAVQFLFKWDYSTRGLLTLQNDDGLLPIHQACLSGNINLVRVLVDGGASTESRSSFGWTALHSATLSGSFELVKFLVEQCAANVLLRDGIDCYASDLTLNSSIRDYLKSKMDEKKLKTKLEALVSTWSTLPEVSRRHSFAAPVRRSERRRLANRTASFHDFHRSDSIIECVEEKESVSNDKVSDEFILECLNDTNSKDDKRDSGVFCMEEIEDEQLAPITDSDHMAKTDHNPSSQNIWGEYSNKCDSFMKNRLNSPSRLLESTKV